MFSRGQSFCSGASYSIPALLARVHRKNLKLKITALLNKFSRIMRFIIKNVWKLNIMIIFAPCLGRAYRKMADLNV